MQNLSRYKWFYESTTCFRILLRKSHISLYISFLPIIEQEGRDDAIITMETVNVIGLTHLHTKALESMWVDTIMVLQRDIRWNKKIFIVHSHNKKDLECLSNYWGWFW